MPIRYVRDVHASRRFFEVLGLGPDPTPPNDYRSELPDNGGRSPFITLPPARPTSN